MLVYRLSAPSPNKHGGGGGVLDGLVLYGVGHGDGTPLPLFGDGFAKVDMSSYRGHRRELVGLIRV